MDYPKNRGNNLIMLNLGCGDRTHDSWVNIDYSLKIRFKQLWFLRPFLGSTCPPGYVHHDLRRGIPFDSNSVDVAYSSHVVEHLNKDQAHFFIQEIHKVLKPNGIVRIVVPDLEYAAKEYLESLYSLRANTGDSQELELRHEWATILLLDQMVRTRPGGEMLEWLHSHRESDFVQNMGGVAKVLANSDDDAGISKIARGAARIFGLRDPSKTGELHRWMYDDITLRRLLIQGGFSDVKRMSHLESRIHGWENFCLDNNPDGTAYMPGSIWMEAVKPESV